MARFVDRCVDCFGLLRLQTSAAPETRLWATVRRQPAQLMLQTLIGGLRLNAAQHSLVHWRPEATLVNWRSDWRRRVRVRCRGLACSASAPPPTACSTPPLLSSRGTWLGLSTRRLWIVHCHNDCGLAVANRGDRSGRRASRPRLTWAILQSRRTFHGCHWCNCG